MKKLDQVFFKSSFLFTLLGFSGLFLILSFINRSIHTDDAWLGEQAYWLAEVGYVKSELFRGLLNYEDQQFVYHKLFIWLGALFVNVFGFKLFVLKSISFLFLSGFLIIFYWYSKKNALLEKPVLLLLIIIIILHPLVFYYSFVFRPELMLMTLGFITYIFLELSHRNNNTTYGVLAGIFAALSLLTHLNGLSFAISGFVVYLIFKQYKVCIFYSLAVALVSTLYFIDLNTVSAIEGYVYQFQNDPALTSNDYSGVWAYVHNLLTEHKRFSRDLKTLIVSLAVIFLMIFGFKALKKHSFLKSFTFLLIVTFATLAQSKTTKYMIIYMPYLWLIAGICLQYILKEKQLKFKYGLVGYLGIYLLFSVGYNLSLFWKNENSVNIHREISERHDLLNKKMVGPVSFIFEQIDDQQIQSVRLYKLLKERRKLHKAGAFDFFDAAEFFDNKSIVLSPESFELLEIPIPSEKGRFGNFELVEIIENEFYIYKHIAIAGK